MNILFQCSEYPPFRNGGIGTVTRIIAEELASQGHHIYVAGYYSELPQYESIEVVNGVTICRYNLGMRKGKLRRILFLVLNKFGLVGNIIQRELSWYENKLATLIEKHHIDVLELTDFYNFNLYKTRLKFRRFNVPTIIRVHGSASFIQHFSGKEQTWVCENDRVHFERADYLSSVSKFSEKYVLDNFRDLIFKEHIVIYNPIEDSFIHHNRQSSQKIILFIGKIIKTKGAFALAEAFNMISNKYPDWELHYAGKGEANAINEMLMPEVRKKVKFLGFCNRETVRKEIDECAFACIPTYFENFSMVPLEIMGRTRAIIFTNRTSGNEIIEDGVDGFTVNPDDINDIRYKMEQLMSDENMRNTFAERGYEKVKGEFSSKSIVKQLLDFYDKCIVLSKKH